MSTVSLSGVGPTTADPADSTAAPRPPTIVCTDALSQLDPCVPEDRLEQLSVSARARKRERVVPRPAASPGGGLFRTVMTSVPLMVADAVVVAACYSLAVFVGSYLSANVIPAYLAWEQSGFAAAFLLTGMCLGLYPATGLSPVVELRQAVLCSLITAFVAVQIKLVVGVAGWTNLGVALLGGLMAAVLVPLVRGSVRSHVSKWSWWGEPVIVVGGGVQGQAIFRYYDRIRNRGLRPIGVVDAGSVDPPASPRISADIPYLGSIRRLPRIARRRGVRWCIIAPGGCDGMDMDEVLRYSRNLPNAILLQSQYSLPSLWSTPRECAGVMGVHVRDHLRNPVAMVLKRSVSVVLSSAALIVLSPLFLLIALAIKVVDPGPVLFGHTRIGRGGRKFKAWKFRSMVVNAQEVLDQHLEANPAARMEWMEDQKLKNDPRILRGIGGVLRKTSLDELPQLWNVLIGEMALVGPRPIVTGEVDKYREMFPLYLRVTPGVTGLWQVSGRNDTSYEERVRLDSYYVSNWSIWLDLYIIVRTVRTMLFREGAY